MRTIPFIASTVAGALVAVKLYIGAAHAEAGPRSFDRWMPEGVNRVLTDHASDIILCPTGCCGESEKESIVDESTMSGMCCV